LPSIQALNSKSHYCQKEREGRKEGRRGREKRKGEREGGRREREGGREERKERAKRREGGREGGKEGKKKKIKEIGHHEFWYINEQSLATPALLLRVFYPA
jgi:hypothetical protein